MEIVETDFSDGALRIVDNDRCVDAIKNLFKTI